MPLDLIDSHFHIWDLDKQNLPWLADCPSIAKTWIFPELVELYAQHKDVNFRGAVYVEVDGDDTTVEEQHIAEAMATHPEILGKVLRTEVTQRIRVPQGANGIRRPLHTPDAPPKTCLQPDFLTGLGDLADAEIPFDACVRTPELRDVYDACLCVPSLSVVVDHCGNVQKIDEKYVEDIKALASLPHVYCKLSGIATKDRGFVRDVYTLLEESFGAERLMYASNWPVVELYGDFHEHLDQVREFFNDDANVFADTARRVYSLH
ncbi:amidohydrolase family protein [Actinotignum urinale]|uniref:Amidohydrolase family protein n=1 Tax=Actinotignum urinale TaxID=190146 RepID=A0AAW9HMA9_9ACTO|nr:amidohydrolase family protein [Actinotignum urinale]MDY5132473.1 amidohydrolase family protein [Actinotignum urinale]MDY5151055.1 amidohydrolase family protein [Actinotignum urinale]MDY5154771.1 amidohydrolase family protein [Actinotignum urinale]MDY5159934.1 amidohydrolase family protein [Actinotignum urinale]WIK58679.1 amidohydrolase family protein [Actinotignum urinale]